MLTTVNRNSYLKKQIMIVILYLLISLLTFYPAVIHMKSTYLGGGGDPFLFMWFLKWVQFAITNHHNLLESHYLFYPDGVNLLWNTSILLAGIIFSPITAIWGPVVTYNSIIILALVASAYTAYLFAKRFVRSDFAAFMSGLLYGFSPYMIAESLGHPHLTIAFIPPLLLLLGYEVLVVQRLALWKSVVLFVLLILTQFLLSEEMLATEAIICFIAVVVLGVLNLPLVREKGMYVLKVVVLGGSISLLLLIPFLYVQFFGPWKPISHLLQPPNVYVTDILNFIIPGPLQWLKNPGTNAVASHFTGNGSEWTSYLGLPLIIVVIYTVQKFINRKAIQFFFVMSVITGVLSMGPHLHVDGYSSNIHLPWTILGKLPVVDNILPARLSVYIFLFVSAIFGEFLGGVLTTRGPRRFIGAVGAVASILFLIPSLPYPNSKIVTPPLFLDGNIKTVISQNAPVLVLPLSAGGSASAMLWQAVSNMYFKMPEGYAINPYGFGPVNSNLNDTLLGIQQSGKIPKPTTSQLSALAGTLYQMKISKIILGPSSSEDQLLDFITTLLGETPLKVGGTYIWDTKTSSRPGFVVSGDYWSSTQEFNWMGKEMSLTTFKTPLVVTLAGFYRPQSVGDDVTVILSDGQSTTYRVSKTSRISFVIPANTNARLLANNTFIPNAYLKNGDNRNLSVLVKLDTNNNN